MHRCQLDPAATIRALLPGSDGDLVGAMEKACATATYVDACTAASDVAAQAAMAAAHASPGGGSGAGGTAAGGAGAGTRDFAPSPPPPSTGEGGGSRGGGGGDVSPSAGAASAKAGGYFVIGCMVFFFTCVVPPFAVVNILKRQGRDVCDFLPAAVHKYVPAAARPKGAGAGYAGMDSELEDF